MDKTVQRFAILIHSSSLKKIKRKIFAKFHDYVKFKINALIFAADYFL